MEPKDSDAQTNINVNGNIDKGTFVVGDGNQVNIDNSVHYHEKDTVHKKINITEFLNEFTRQSRTFTQEQIISFITSQLNTKLYKWQTSTIFTIFPPTKPSVPNNDLRGLKVLKFSRNTGTRIALRVQVDERYKIKRNEKPDKESHLKIIGRTVARVVILPIEVEKIYSNNFIEQGSYQRPICNECGGKRTVIKDGSSVNCNHCNGYGYTETYTENIRYVYPKETILYSNAPSAFPEKKWKFLWHTISDNAYSDLPFEIDVLKDKVEEIKAKYREALREIELEAKSMKIRPRLSIELEKYLSVENPEKQGLERIKDDPSTPIIIESFFHEIAQLYGYKGLNIEVENIFVNQYKYTAEGVVVYELEYVRPFECSVGVLMWKKVKKGIIEGKLYISDGANGLEIYKQTEQFKNWAE